MKNLKDAVYMLLSCPNYSFCFFVLIESYWSSVVNFFIPNDCIGFVHVTSKTRVGPQGLTLLPARVGPLELAHLAWPLGLARKGFSH